MIIYPIETHKIYKTLFGVDENGREINVYNLKNVISTGKSLLYPNTLLMEYGTLYNPINEKIMSLKDVEKNPLFFPQPKICGKIENDPVFFFVYNTDNYFHFIYDTLPYLISYFELRKDIPNLKLLVNYPNESMTQFYRFVTESLSILGINESDLCIINEDTIYKSVYVSDSYTHGIDSNLPPRAEIHDFYKEMVDKVKTDDIHPKKVYISRRSWVHGNMCNMGTNYTTRRKLANEDVLVELLEEHGYTEVFTENMSMVEKINLFANAEKIVGPIGGGLVNALFSNKECEMMAIISPEFFNVNERFKFSINNVNLNLFEDVEHVERTDLKLYMRVNVDGIVGEIIEIDGDTAKISFSDTSIAGWNSESEYKTMDVNVSECIKLDNGLNSLWRMNLKKFKEKYL